MGLFGLWVAVSTIEHTLAGTVPRAEIMGAIGLLALAANLAVAVLLYRYRTADSQALSVWLCTRNDCIANLAVLAAGVGVWISQVPWPDVLVGAMIAWLGLSSAVQVLRQAHHELRAFGLFRRGSEVTYRVISTITQRQRLLSGQRREAQS